MKLASLFFCIYILCSALRAALPPDGWRVKIPIAITPQQQKFPEMVVKGDNVHVIWLDNRDGYFRVYYKKSNDAGFSWTTEIPISLADEIIPEERRIISISGIGNFLYVVYAKYDSPPDDAYKLCFRRSTDDGATWTSYQILVTGLANLPELAILATSDSVRLVFRQDPYICYTASGNNGTTWSTFDQIDFGGPYPECCPDLVTINNIAHVTFVSNEIGSPSYGYIFHARPMGSGWLTTEVLVSVNKTFYYPNITADLQGYLYIKCEDTIRVNEPSSGAIKCLVSTDDGNNWNGGSNAAIQKAGSDLVTVGLNQIMVVCGDANYVYACYGDYVPSGDIIWDSPIILEDISFDPPACKPHCRIAEGDLARHLVFHAGYGNNQDLAYMANDKDLLSNSGEATAFNNGRHLVRDPFNHCLHLVYYSQNRIHYSFANDNDLIWSPYHIIEEPVNQTKDNGIYPSIGLYPGMVNMWPCIVYCSPDKKEILYRWYHEFSGQWQGFTIFSITPNVEVTPPSLVIYGDRVMVVFSTQNTVINTSAIYFYDFAYSATAPGLPIILESSTTSVLAGSFASITVDGNGDPHCVWTKKVLPNNYTDVFYRVRTAGVWSPPLSQSPYRVSDQSPNYNDKCPHIDDYGNDLSVVWYSDIPDDVWRRRKDIQRDRWFNIGSSYSQSPGIPSEYPVNAAHDFSVWCEKPGSDFDIRYRSDTYGFGWVCQQPEKESFCHSQLQRDHSPWDLYTIFTKGNSAPYIVNSVHQQFGIPPGGKSAFYSVETGEDSASGFCIQRDSTIQYNAYHVDYGVNKLTYDLCLLEPTFPFHELIGTVYFEGTGNKVHEIWINGTKKLNLVVHSNQAYDFDLLLPQILYKNTHRITVTLINPENTGAYLGRLEVFRLTDHDYGGPQSFGESKLTQSSTLLLMPNPFSKSLNIIFKRQKNDKAYIHIYNVAGWLVKSLLLPDINAGYSHDIITWDGKDDCGNKQPGGIYFIELKSGNTKTTAKAVLLN
jgi:hypothetical protein